MNDQPADQSTPKEGEPRRDLSARYERRREEILDIATGLLNQRGFTGMTFAEVARSLSLSTTSINYYFASKEKLAATIISDSLDRLEAIACEAGEEATPRDCVRRYVGLHFALVVQAAAGERRPFANLSEIRTLDESARQALLAQYQRVFRLVRGFFGASDTPFDKARNTARAHVVNETLFWAERWLGRYAPEDVGGVAERLFTILDGGVAPHSAKPAPRPRVADRQASPRRGGEASFLPAATRLINDHGYRGASIDRVVAELKVTKGSFYHHVDAKDDLVLECFRQSYERTMALLRDAKQSADNAWGGLGNAIAMLVNLQFASPFPLTRSSALQAMPQPVRTMALALLERTALHIGGVLVDGIRDGSVLPIDPVIASQFLLSTVNASYDMRNWARRMGEDEAARLYVSILQHGLFDARVC